MLSLNQIKNRLISYFSSHAQVNSVIYGDNFKFAAERNLKYPVANIEWLESNVSGKTMNHTFRLILADKTNPNIDAIQDEISSDMLLIADDFMSYLQDTEGWSFIRSSQIVKLTDEYLDRIDGIKFRISLSTIRRQNICVTPTK